MRSGPPPRPGQSIAPDMGADQKICGIAQSGDITYLISTNATINGVAGETSELFRCLNLQTAASSGKNTPLWSKVSVGATDVPPPGAGHGLVPVGDLGEGLLFLLCMSILISHSIPPKKVWYNGGRCGDACLIWSGPSARHSEIVTVPTASEKRSGNLDCLTVSLL